MGLLLQSTVYRPDVEVCRLAGSWERGTLVGLGTPAHRHCNDTTEPENHGTFRAMSSCKQARFVVGQGNKKGHTRISCVKGSQGEFACLMSSFLKPKTEMFRSPIWSETVVKGAFEGPPQARKIRSWSSKGAYPIPPWGWGGGSPI